MCHPKLASFLGLRNWGKGGWVFGACSVFMHFFLAILLLSDSEAAKPVWDHILGCTLCITLCSSPNRRLKTKWFDLRNKLSYKRYTVERMDFLSFFPRKISEQIFTSIPLHHENW